MTWWYFIWGWILGTSMNKDSDPVSLAQIQEDLAVLVDKIKNASGRAFGPIKEFMSTIFILTLCILPVIALIRIIEAIIDIHSKRKTQ